MKLKNKKTGEIGLVHCDATMFSNKIGVFIDNNHIDLRNPYKIYTSLAELNEEWEDYEEPKVGFIIDLMEEDCISADDSGYEDSDVERAKELGIWFESEEEAERAVEKLKAWKRLKDKGFKFEGIKEDFTRILQQNPFRTGKRYLQFNKSEDEDWMKENWNDLDLLFGEEEE